MAQGYTLQQLQQMGAQPVKKGYTLDQLKAQQFPTTDPTHHSFLQRVKNVFNSAGRSIVDTIQGNTLTDQGLQPNEAANQSIARRAIEGVAAPAFNTIPGTLMAALPEKAGNAITKGGTNLLNWFTNSVANNPAHTPFGTIPALSDIKSFQKFTISNAGKTTEDIAGIASGLGQISNDILIADQGANVLQKGVDTTTKVVNKATSLDARYGNLQTQPLDEAKLIDRYNRAIRPTVKGKTNSTQIAKGNDQVLSAVKSIGENKPNLEFTDANGEPIQGQLPKSVDQFTQAITQTKKSIFQQYDALAKQAGDQGIAVDTKSIASELNPVIDSKALKIANPRAIEYAQNLQQRLLAEGSIDAPTVQDIIQHYNEALKAFYRNPNYETASTASIDAMVANKFREALDAQITDATGTQYQALKNQYGALASIEKDVAHRNIVWGRQNTVGLTSGLSDIASGTELVRGLIKLNPADLAASGVIKGLQKYIKYLNDPDVGVSKIFSQIENSGPSATGSSLLPGEGPQVGSSLPNDNITPAKSQTLLGGRDITPQSILNLEKKVKGYKPSVGLSIESPKRIPQDDLNTMSDFTDYVAKSYKPTSTEIHQLELAASRIAEKYGLKIGKTNKSIANAFGKVLEQQGFKRPDLNKFMKVPVGK
jgi:hypothetical protein